MSTVTGIAPQAVFPSGMLDRPQSPAVPTPRQDSLLFKPVNETEAASRSENRREINPDERRQDNQRGRRPSFAEGSALDRLQPNRISRQALEAADRQGKLTPEEAQRLEELQQLETRDREVRAHEQAHKAVAGQYAGSIRYEFVQGPDGRRYAVAGEVPIDLSPAPTPEETINKMEQVRRAALAPSDPSDADRRIAAEATQLIQDARAEALRQQRAEAQASSELRETERSLEQTRLEAERTARQEQERAAEDEESDEALDERRAAVNTEVELRLARVQAAITELLRNQGASLDQVTLGRNINSQI
ncbi:MAG: hypothetical protein LAT62_14300 [Natronospirillum sp.]|uniref:putative metalloprotease CJM1_0395 family protein n=1 Tax=Natronospirillum sp. TaxID=2812955 RepID=UPI0025E0F47F|nr:putative metalloprotease CJM1_0395 family protein [Natronospirillum sp.]MCH8553105.1 hypothetical protein [Natronospirillum sp.]